MSLVSTRGSPKLKIAQHPVAAFLLILYPLSWILYVPSLLGKSGFGVIGVDIPYQISVPLITVFGLTGIAFLVTRIADGKAGVRALLRRYYHFRTGIQWYLVAVLGAPGLLLAVGLLIRGSS